MKLVAKNLRKNYGSREILHNLNVFISEGEVVGLIGPNGAGKTTAFYIMVGILPTDYGSITLNGIDITKEPLHQRAKMGIGYLPQEVSVFRGLSVEDNIMSVLEFRRDLDKDARYNKLEDMLEEFGLTHIRKNLGARLSGGEKRRTEVARAVAMEPKFLFLDEPFAGVDPLSVGEIQEIIKRVKQKHRIGIMITDHNIRETLDICDRSYVLYKGDILAEGDSDTIYNDENVKRYYLGESFSL